MMQKKDLFRSVLGATGSTYYYDYYFAYIEDSSISKYVNKYVGQMIDYINAHPYSTVKTKYFRNGSWHVGEDVHVVDNEYLRTDPNNIKRDNLGEL